MKDKHTTMDSSNFTHYIYEDFSKVTHISDCDLRYVSRTLLTRGAEEAYFRYILSDGPKAEAYKTLKLLLNTVIDRLNEIINKDGSIVDRYRHVLLQALVYARYLIAIEREETASQFELLERRLKNPRRRVRIDVDRVA